MSRHPGDARRFLTLRACVRTALAAGIAAAAYLIGLPAFGVIFPHRPLSTATMRFDGFIPLPVGQDRGLISVLDYLTVEGGNLFVASIRPGAVFRVPLLGADRIPTADAVAVMRGPPSAHGVVFDPVSGLGFVSRSDANTVDIFDPRTLAIKKRVPVPADVDGIFFDPVDGLVYAASGQPQLGTLIDARHGAVVGQIRLGGTPESAVFDQRTGLFYQNLNSVNAVASVDPRKRAVINQWFLPSCDGPSGMALDGKRRLLFIACQRNSVMIVFDLKTHEITAKVPVGGGPDVVAYDAALGRIYTTGRSGRLMGLEDNGGRLRVLDQIQLEFAAHTLAVDPNTHRVYVGYLSLFRDPRLAVFSPLPE
ncbi:MAG: hypothetical protein M3N34_05820 [Pseudomonadota bacterium]|nr:hypothetical protein [Pseudomonadota bacterium]